MKAKLLEHQAPGGARTPMEEHLPLAAPWVVQIFPIYACNFRCKYCHFSIPKSQRPFVTSHADMDIALYRKCIDGMAGFPEKTRVLRFVGMGEPLLHKDIDAMIAYAKQAHVAGRVELLTNGSLLAPDISDRLLAAGLDRLVVSLQGTSAEKYRAVSGVDLDFVALVEQLGYFYKHKRHTHVYMKIVDIALDDDADRRRFFDLFGDICDSIGIETAGPHYPGVTHNSELADRAETQFGTKLVPVKICPQSFFTLQVNPDGKVAGCYAVPHPEDLGDCAENPLPEIWNGEAFNRFRRRMLQGRETVCSACRDCGVIAYRMQKEDCIVNANRRLEKIYEKSS
jgi:radical SAM protein with 4Fe4S-binding SPASM domain